MYIYILCCNTLLPRRLGVCNVAEKHALSESLQGTHNRNHNRYGAGILQQRRPVCVYGSALCDAHNILAPLVILNIFRWRCAQCVQRAGTASRLRSTLLTLVRVPLILAALLDRRAMSITMYMKCQRSGLWPRYRSVESWLQSCLTRGCWEVLQKKRLRKFSPGQGRDNLKIITWNNIMFCFLILRSRIKNSER